MDDRIGNSKIISREKCKLANTDHKTPFNTVNASKTADDKKTIAMSKAQEAQAYIVKVSDESARIPVRNENQEKKATTIEDKQHSGLSTKLTSADKKQLGIKEAFNRVSKVR